MSRQTGRFISELRSSNAAGIHGKTSTDRYNTERRAIEEDIMFSVNLEDLEGPSPEDLAKIENDDDFWNSIVDPEDYELSDDDREVEFDEDEYGVDSYDSYYDR